MKSILRAKRTELIGWANFFNSWATRAGAGPGPGATGDGKMNVLKCVLQS